MEIRKMRVIRSSAGGTAKGSADSFKISLPTLWVREMGLDISSDVEISFDGECIRIKKVMTPIEFASKAYSLGHNVKKLCFYRGNDLKSTIYADMDEKAVMVENHTTDIQEMAFGKNTMPSWEDFNYFLGERCLPRERFGIREYLESIGLLQYDPLEIIKITKGRMAEDDFLLTVQDYE